MKNNLSSNILVTCLSFILILFLVAFIFNNGVDSHFTFSYLLDLISDYEPDIPVTRTLINYSIDGSWGVFDFFRTSFNMLISVVNIIMFLATNAINSVAFLLYFVNNMFLGV